MQYNSYSMHTHSLIHTKNRRVNKSDWRLSGEHKSIGRSSLIRWNVNVNASDRERVVSSSIFQFQWIVCLTVFFSLARFLFWILLVFSRSFFTSIFFNYEFFSGLHMVLSVFIFISFIWWRSIPDDWLCVWGNKKESIWNNKMTIDLMGNDDSTAETV